MILLINIIINPHGFRLVAYIPTLQSLRVRAGIPVSKLARAAGVDRATVARAEAGGNCRAESLYSIVNALNVLFYAEQEGRLDGAKLIKQAHNRRLKKKGER